MVPPVRSDVQADAGQLRPSRCSIRRCPDGAALVLAAAGHGCAPAGIAVLAFRHTVVFCVAWLLIAGATLEMTLQHLFGPASYQSTIAAVKGAELVLAGVCVLRYGLSPDVFNPGLAFLAMFVAGQAHGLHHDLTQSESLRSLAGSVAPFAFAFSRLSRNWARAVIRTTAWIPLVSVAGGGILDLAGLRPVFLDSGGQRLAGLGHPAFLAGFCLTAIYACLIELYREGRTRTLLLLAVNFLILVLTGARAPLAYAVAVTGLTLVFVRSPAFPRRARILPMLLAACLLPLLVLLANDLSSVRLFNVLSNEAGNLSGRDLLWPPFEQAAAASPWVGWGVGAGNVIIPADSELAQPDADLGGAQRVSPHTSGGRHDRPRPARRSVRPVGRCTIRGSCVAPTARSCGSPSRPSPPMRIPTTC